MIKIRECYETPANRKKVSKYAGNQWYIIWCSFKQNKLAFVSGILLLVVYLIALLAEFFAPTLPTTVSESNINCPPTAVHVVDKVGNWHPPFVYKYEQVVDQKTLQRKYVENTNVIYPVGLFVRCEPYKVLGGLFTLDLHLFGVDGKYFDQGIRVSLLGTDPLGRDVFSRIIYGTRISMTLGLFGVALSFLLAILLGFISGYFAGVADIIIQRIIEVLTSLPTIPLWMALAVAIPMSWSVTKVFFAVSVILSLISWPGQARIIRGKVMQMKDKDFVKAAELDNARFFRKMFKYFVPSIMSQLIASVTLAIPGMILGETALSFLGLGLQPPAISWGVLLKDAQNVQTILQTPWLMFTAVPVILVVLAFNFLGDGLRDAADPYKN